MVKINHYEERRSLVCVARGCEQFYTTMNTANENAATESLH